MNMHVDVRWHEATEITGIQGPSYSKRYLGTKRLHRKSKTRNAQHVICAEIHPMGSTNTSIFDLIVDTRF